MPKNETALYVQIDEDLKRRFRVAVQIDGLDMKTYVVKLIEDYVALKEAENKSLFAQLLQLEAKRETRKPTSPQSIRKTA